MDKKKVAEFMQLFSNQKTQVWTRERHNALSDLVSSINIVRSLEDSSFYDIPANRNAKILLDEFQIDKACISNVKGLTISLQHHQKCGRALMWFGKPCLQFRCTDCEFSFAAIVVLRPHSICRDCGFKRPCCSFSLLFAARYN